MRAGWVAATLICSALLTQSAQAAAWPELPDPPRAKVEWVARDSVVNGLPTRISHFDSELSVAEVLTFYRTRWAKASVGEPREISSGTWRAISTINGGFQLVVQVRAKKPGGSEGMLSVAHFAEAKKDFIPKSLPNWHDAQVTQVTTSTDGPKRSHLVAMVSREGFDMNVRRWRDEWKRRGFALRHEATPPLADGTRSWVGSFEQGSRSADVTVSFRESDRKTFMTVNLIGLEGEGSP